MSSEKSIRLDAFRSNSEVAGFLAVRSMSVVMREKQKVCQCRKKRGDSLVHLANLLDFTCRKIKTPECNEATQQIGCKFFNRIAKIIHYRR